MITGFILLNSFLFSVYSWWMPLVEKHLQDEIVQLLSFSRLGAFVPASDVGRILSPRGMQVSRICLRDFINTIKTWGKENNLRHLDIMMFWCFDV